MNKINLYLEQISTQAPELLKQRMLAVRDPGCWDLNDAREGLEIIIMGAYHGNTQTIIHNNYVVEIRKPSPRHAKGNNKNTQVEKYTSGFKMSINCG